MQFIDSSIAFVPVTSLEIAKEVSRILYKLTCPISSSENVTEFYCTWVEHPTTKDVRIAWSKEPQPIHPDANIYAFDSILNGFIAKNYIQEADKIAVQNAIEAAKGTQFVMYDALPSFWKGMAKSYGQLQGEGWFPSTEIT